MSTKKTSTASRSLKSANRRTVTISRDVFMRLRIALAVNIRELEQGLNNVIPFAHSALYGFEKYENESDRNRDRMCKDVLRDDCHKLARLMHLHDELSQAGGAA